MASINLPTLLTLIRLIVSPLILPILFTYLLPTTFFFIHIAMAFLFVALCITDFFDGYLARKYNQETRLGKVLDPMADKFLLYATLISLVAIERVYFYWAIIFIGREFFVMGLRIAALEKGFSVPVDWLGKLKTAVQSVYLTLVILNPKQCLQSPIPADYAVICKFLNTLETITLIIALVLSLSSGYLYFISFKQRYFAQQTPS